MDDKLIPFLDQWNFLASIQGLTSTKLADATLGQVEVAIPLILPLVWKKKNHDDGHHPLQGYSIPYPRLPLVLANRIFIVKKEIPQTLTNRLIRLAALQNLEFYNALAMRNKPRVIGCAENFPHHIGLPMGYLEAMNELLREHDIQAVYQNERIPERTISVRFIGKLRKDYTKAAQKMLEHETGVLCAPTAFGKTVTAAALIARRKVSTLVLVHRTALLRQ